MTAEAKQIVERAFRILRGKEKFDLDQFAYRSEAALASFKEAVALDPNSYDAWLGLGLSYAFWPSRFDDAFSSFTKAQQINPERPDSFYQLGRLLLRHAETNYETAEPRDLERALGFFDQAATLGYEDPGGLYNLMGTTYFRLKRYREALECFEQSAATAKPESWFPSTYFLAAEANELEGNLEEALRWYESYFDKVFQDEDVRLKIRNIKTLLENRRKALQTINTNKAPGVQLQVQDIKRADAYFKESWGLIQEPRSGSQKQTIGELMTPDFSGLVRQVVAMLVDRDYDGLQRLTNSTRLTAGEIAQLRSYISDAATC